MADWKFPVEASHVMMFARAIGDPNPIYYDSEYAARTEVGSIIAPPTFVQASAQFDPEYVLRPRPGEPWMGSGRTPSGWLDRPQRNGSGTGLHGEQHYEYRRALRPGDVLTPRHREGRTWQTQGRRGGALNFREAITEYIDQDGELVLVARAVLVRTERPVSED